MLAEEHGFDVKAMEKEGGIFIILVALFNDLVPYLFYSRGFINTARVFKMLFYPVSFCIGFIAYFLDKLDKEKNLTLQYECIFVKKKFTDIG